MVWSPAATGVACSGLVELAEVLTTVRSEPGFGADSPLHSSITALTVCVTVGGDGQSSAVFEIVSRFSDGAKLTVTAAVVVVNVVEALAGALTSPLAEPAVQCAGTAT